MKRSEMVKLIEENINSFLENQCGYAKLSNADAENLLMHLEFSGMLPPFSAKIRQVDILDKWSVNTGRQEIVRVIEPQWDEE